MWSFAFQLREQLLFLFWTAALKMHSTKLMIKYSNPKGDCQGLEIVVYKQCRPVELSSSGA